VKRKTKLKYNVFG